jgi:Rhodopirellula transposase DDE domain
MGISFPHENRTLLFETLLCEQGAGRSVMPTPASIAAVRNKYQALRPVMDEKVRRRWAACEAMAIGWGGITAVAAATGLSRPTLRAGIAEVQGGAPRAEEGQPTEAQRIRRDGGGRRRLTAGDRTLLQDLQALLESSTRGDPQSPLLWTSKSTRHLADALVQQGHHVSHHTIARLLDDLHYSLQANRKTKEGGSHPDRDAQFEHINTQVRAFQKRGQPVVSVDAKKKELIGDFKNAGREWHPQGQPVKVRSKDFLDKQLGKGIPYGVYDITANNGWVSVGIDHDTAQFAAESLRRWWQHMGSRVYPRAKELLVTADAGGSNGYRIRLWKVAVQELADAIGLRISVCHFPPGTSKWNKIEHRMCCHITENWRGKPLVSRAVIVNLIGNTKTRTGLTITADLDENTYPTGIKVSAAELAAIRLNPDTFHGDWNYTILPRA